MENHCIQQCDVNPNGHDSAVVDSEGRHHCGYCDEFSSCPGLKESKMEKKWVLTFGDGTWVTLDSKPFIFEATQEQIDNMDEAPTDCGSGFHFHVIDLVHYYLRTCDIDPHMLFE